MAGQSASRAWTQGNVSSWGLRQRKSLLSGLVFFMARAAALFPLLLLIAVLAPFGLGVLLASASGFPAEGPVLVVESLAVVALMTGQWLLLPLFAVIPVAESLSSMIHIGYFKLTKRLYGEGRRIFKMALLHHHFEMLGWPETHISQRFWMVNLLSAMLGIALALL